MNRDDITRRTGEAWGWIRSWPLAVQAVVALALLIVVLVAVNSFTGFLGGAMDNVHSWFYERRDAADVKKIAEDERVIAEREAELVEERKVTEEYRVKYELAVRAYALDHQRGADLDDAITKQYDAMAERAANPSAADVTDDELLRRLREHAAVKRSPAR